MAMWLLEISYRQAHRNQPFGGQPRQGYSRLDFYRKVLEVVASQLTEMAA